MNIMPQSHQQSSSAGRQLALMAGALMVLSLLVVRLIDVQLVRGREFRLQAEDNRFFSRPISADRGLLLDRFGQVLAQNTRLYKKFDQRFSLYQQGELIERQEALPLMATEPGRVGFISARQYPYGDALAAIVGHLGAISVAQLQENQDLLPDAQVGKLGLELNFEKTLRGRTGKETLEINALGVPQRTLTTQLPTPGQNVTTTLDATLTEIAFQALGDQKGAVIISDASSGAVLALVTKPSFDPSLFTQTLDAAKAMAQQKALQAQLTDERQLFFNRAVSGSYPPGSVFKLVTALAGLETGSFDAQTTVVDEGSLKVGDYEYRNWYFTQYGRTEGSISLQRALARSNDTYFYKAAEWIGPEKLAEFARQFGFGKAPGTALGVEASGLVPDPAWKEKTLGERWYLGNTYHFGIGQGDLLVSPLQINQLVQAIANQGRLCVPNLIVGIQPNCRELGFQPQNQQVVLKGMLDACSPGGTAFPFFPHNQQRRQPDLTAEAELWRGAMACKTGTAEFGGIVDAQGHRRTHGWFVAIIEPQLATAETETTNASSAANLADDEVSKLSHHQWLAEVRKWGFPKRIVMTVLVESDDQQLYKEGSREAAPVAKKIVDWMESGTSTSQSVTVPVSPGD